MAQAPCSSGKHLFATRCPSTASATGCVNTAVKHSQQMRQYAYTFKRKTFATLRALQSTFSGLCPPRHARCNCLKSFRERGPTLGLSRRFLHQRGQTAPKKMMARASYRVRLPSKRPRTASASPARTLNAPPERRIREA